MQQSLWFFIRYFFFLYISHRAKWSMRDTHTINIFYRDYIIEQSIDQYVRHWCAIFFFYFLPLLGFWYCIIGNGSVVASRRVLCVRDACDEKKKNVNYNYLQSTFILQCVLLILIHFHSRLFYYTWDVSW